MSILKIAREKQSKGVKLSRLEKKSIKQSEKHAAWRAKRLDALVSDLEQTGLRCAVIEERYVITCSGDVFSVTGKSQKKLSPGTKPGGYLFVGMKVGGEFKYKMVHRLVAESFIPNPQRKPQVNHLDGDKTNNQVDNLEWATPKENQMHASKNGLIPRGERHHLAKLNDDDVIYIRSCGGSCREIAERYGVCAQTINNIRLRKAWKHVK